MPDSNYLLKIVPESVKVIIIRPRKKKGESHYFTGSLVAIGTILPLISLDVNEPVRVRVSVTVYQKTYIPILSLKVYIGGKDACLNVHQHPPASHSLRSQSNDFHIPSLLFNMQFLTKLLCLASLSGSLVSAVTPIRAENGCASHPTYNSGTGYSGGFVVRAWSVDGNSSFELEGHGGQTKKYSENGVEVGFNFLAFVHHLAEDCF